MAARSSPRPAADGNDEPDYIGHRKRLRDRLLNGGTAALPDYELLEFLLFGALPQRDTKKIAKALIERFGGFAGVLGADREALVAVPGVKEATAALLLAVHEAGMRQSRAAVAGRSVIASWQELIAYINARAGTAAAEQFHLIFLDRKNAIIADETQQRGTTDHVPVYPREVVKRALELGASAVIMVHNHPSGDTTPSKGDIEMTRNVAKALAAVGLTLHDHVVIGRGKHSSFKTLGLL